VAGILALFFIWRRDLVANMIGHWFVEFIGNMLSRLLRQAVRSRGSCVSNTLLNAD
jgi:hypothetical protein